MDECVQYAYLSVPEFQKRLAEHPVGYLSLGTLEWHGLQNVLGSDSLQAEGLFLRAARRYGGIVFPSLFVGPDRIEDAGEGTKLIGMDSSDATRPHQQLPGSCYWISKEIFLSLLESIIAKPNVQGLSACSLMGMDRAEKLGLKWLRSGKNSMIFILLSSINDFDPLAYLTQNDHAGKIETSTMMALHPDLVDLSRLDPSSWPLGVKGEDPRTSSAAWGEYLLETTVQSIGRKLQELGL